MEARVAEPGQMRGSQSGEIRKKGKEYSSVSFSFSSSTSSSPFLIVATSLLRARLKILPPLFSTLKSNPLRRRKQGWNQIRRFEQANNRRSRPIRGSWVQLPPLALWTIFKMEGAFGKLKHNEKQPELPTRRLRHEALAALHIAISAADPKRIVRANLKLRKSRLRVGSIAIDLDSFDRVFVIGGGKASAAMGEELERILGTRISGGVINYPDYLRPRPRSRLIFYNEATHPVPSVKGVRGVEKMLNLLGKPTRKDLVFCLISGGGSALLPRPVKGVTLSDKQKTTELLLESGASISEINCVRKHLSSIKGGRLAELLYPARVISLIISDVVGDRLDSIASGPTAPDSTTYQDAKQVLSKYRLFERVPSRVRRIIREGLAGRSPETPKPGSKIF